MERLRKPNLVRSNLLFVNHEFRMGVSNLIALTVPL
jgi:hypothetical protein